ncbi:mitochondrial FAD carrier protein [Melampsora americana]|nr:mitochondrial FAD carrier protein [Melampsora americana]
MPENSRGNSRAALFGSQAIDQAVCGIGAGCISVLCMHPLDLLKVKFQVATTPVHLKPTLSQVSQIASSTSTRPKIITSLGEIVRSDGWKGLYRGLIPNMVGNAASWGLYFMWYSTIKKRMSTSADGSDSGVKLSATEHLFASASSGVITAMMTNPIWVVKTRMFTTQVRSPGAYRNVLDGLIRISREEGPRGLWKGSVLALVGVSNGAIQFMTYEELKKWRQEVRRQKSGITYASMGEDDPTALSNIEYVILSGAAKLLAIGITYPYQVVRSRLQSQMYLSSASRVLESTANLSTTHYYSIPHCITHTYRTEGFKAFYKGLGTNAVRVLPGTCVTFVVYENLSRWFREVAEKRSALS